MARGHILVLLRVVESLVSVADCLFHHFQLCRWPAPKNVKPNEMTVSTKWLLTAAVAANLVLLGYYKYANFFVTNVNLAIGTDLQFRKSSCHWPYPFSPSSKSHTLSTLRGHYG